MKKTVMKRLVTLLLALTLIVGILPFQASAGIYGTNYSGFTTKVGNVTLPLPEYPNGSACTNNGSPCSGPGHFGSNCKRYYYYNGQTVDVLGWQCCGFARYVFWRCFGVVPTDGNGNGYYKAVSNVGGGSISVGYLQSIFGSKVKAGAHIRTGLGQDGFNHSMIYAGCDSNYVYTYEGNFDGYCRVSMVRRTWSEMASYLQYKNGIYYIDMPNNYPASSNGKYTDPVVFNAGYYREHNSDLANMNDSQLQDHWVNYGIKEGRCASAAFDVRWYLATNPDLRNAFGNNYAGVLEHFVDHGIYEGRSGSSTFNLNNYKSTNVDLINAFGNDNYAYYKHYAQNGYYENRTTGLISGAYTIGMYNDNNYKVDIGSSADNGAEAYIWEQTYADSQKFAIENDGTGAYTVRALSSNKYLEILYGGANGEYKVTQCHYTGADCQKWYVINQGDGSYSLLNKGTGKYMDLANGTVANGTSIQTWEGNASAAQKFWLTPVDTLIDGVYTVRSSVNTDWGWDISGYSMDSGANLQVWNSQHKFVIQHDDSGYYTIRALGSGHYIDVPYCKMDNGTSLWQCTYNGGDAQKWLITPNADGTYSFASKCSGKRIDAYGGGDPYNGQDIVEYTGNSSSAQKWVLNLQSEAPEGTFFISYAANPNYRLEIQNRSTDNGGNLILFGAHGATSQQFTLAKRSDGYYTITNVNSGKQLDTAGGGKWNGANIQQWTGDGVNQNWSIIPNTDGSYSFVSRTNNRYLDLWNVEVKNDTNIHCWVNNGGAAQRWDLHKVDSVANGAYSIKSAVDTNFSMDVSGQSLKDSVDIHLWTSHDGNSQKFIFASVGGGYYKIINANSSKVMDVRDANAADGTILQQYSDNGSDAQRWLLLHNVDDTYTFVNALGGYALDLDNGVAENGRRIHLWSAHNGINQKWRLTATTFEILNGWHTMDGYTNFYVNNQKIVGWLASGSNIYHTDGDGNMQTGWQIIDGRYRYFNTDGTMRTGWITTTSGKCYYLGHDGAMATGWISMGDKLYYCDADGVRVTGTQSINGQIFTFDANGALQN